MGDLFYVENLFREEQKKVKKRKKSGKATLSFALDDEGEGEGGADPTSGSATPPASVDPENQSQHKKFKKNPAVDTSFLPDREREEAERRDREELRQQWLKRQEEMKKEEIEITYSYWDGSGHRKSVVVSLIYLPFVQAGIPVVHLACSARRVMISLPFWKSVGNNSQNFERSMSTILCTLRLVNPYSAYPTIRTHRHLQEDLIIPQVSMIHLHCPQLIFVHQHHTFYDFIINKARGKSGPLFNFDVHDDVRLLADATKEKDESHAGKVVERSWYQRNKHIFPASRWEVSLRRSFCCPYADCLPNCHAFMLGFWWDQVFDPEKNYGQYTIA